MLRRVEQSHYVPVYFERVRDIDVAGDGLPKEMGYRRLAVSRCPVDQRGPAGKDGPPDSIQCLVAQDELFECGGDGLGCEATAGDSLPVGLMI